MKELKRELESANSRLSELKSASLLENVREVKGYSLLTAQLDTKPDEARSICDSFKSKYPNGVIVLATVFAGKLNFVSAVGSEAVKKGAHAGNILKEISLICDGRGGGRPDSAMSGGKDISKVPAALAEVEKLL